MRASERCQLAQANVARMRAPLEDPLMEGFRSQLEAINALADASPGFVWRLQTEDGDATAIRAYEDEMMSPPGEPGGPAPKVEAEFCRA